MKNFKKALCMFLALVMCLGMLPMAAFAEETTPEQTVITAGEGTDETSKAEEPKADEPKADEPKADEPKADEPKAKADEPKADEPKTEVKDEVKDEVKAFLDAVAKLPDSIETAEEYDAVETALPEILPLYQAFDEDDYEREGVEEALMKLSLLQEQLGMDRPDPKALINISVAKVSIQQTTGGISYNPSFTWGGNHYSGNHGDWSVNGTATADKRLLTHVSLPVLSDGWTTYIPRTYTYRVDNINDPNNIIERIYGSVGYGTVPGWSGQYEGFQTNVLTTGKGSGTATFDIVLGYYFAYLGVNCIRTLHFTITQNSDLDYNSEHWVRVPDTNLAEDSTELGFTIFDETTSKYADIRNVSISKNEVGNHAQFTPEVITDDGVKVAQVNVQGVEATNNGSLPVYLTYEYWGSKDGVKYEWRTRTEKINVTVYTPGTIDLSVGGKKTDTFYGGSADEVEECAANPSSVVTATRTGTRYTLTGKAEGSAKFRAKYGYYSGNNQNQLHVFVDVVNVAVSAPTAPKREDLNGILGNFVQVKCVTEDANGNALHEPKTYCTKDNQVDGKYEAEVGEVYLDDNTYKVNVTLNGSVYASFYGLQPAFGTGVDHKLAANENATKTVTLTWDATAKNGNGAWTSGQNKGTVLATFEVVCKDPCPHTNVDYTDNENGTHDGVCAECHETVVDNENHSDSGNDGFCDKCGACMHEHDKDGYCTNPKCDHKNSDGTQKNCCPKPAPETPNLTVTKMASVSGSVKPGDEFYYLITVTNNGSAVKNVVITDVLDSNLEFKSAVGSGSVKTWTSEPENGRYVVGNLSESGVQGKDFATVTITAKVKDDASNGTIRNTATADCDGMPEDKKPSDTKDVTVDGGNEPETKYTVTWKDGDTVIGTGETEDPTKIPQAPAVPTPPEDKEFDKWGEPVVDEENKTITIQIVWKDKTPDPEQPETYTVTYTDGVEGSEVFADQTYTVKENDPTPAFNGTPTRSGYTFTGWTPAVTATVTGNVTYSAQWTQNTTTPPSGGGNGGGGGGGTDVPDSDVPTTDIPDPDVPLANVDGLNNTDHFAYIIGRGDNGVQPMANMTRSEAAGLFFRLMTEEFRVAHWATVSSFPDVDPESWCSVEIATAEKAGILVGSDDGNMYPNKTITRAEFTVMAVRFLDNSITDDGIGDFDDTVNHWAAKEIRLAVKAGWMQGVGGNRFNPDAPITRAEVVTIVNRMLDRVPDETFPEGTIHWVDNPVDAWYYGDMMEATNGHEYERGEDGVVEHWTKITPYRDWIALKEEWIANNGASAQK